MSQTIRNQTKTTRPTKTSFQRPWYVVDASKDSLGRVATLTANLLTGKNRADYSQDVDMGAMVVVINADKIQLTGKKPEKKVYFRHTGRIGGLSYRTFAKQMQLDSSVPFYKAVSGMLPKNRHRDLRLNNRLFIFPGEEHNITHKLTEAN